MEAEVNGSLLLLVIGTAFLVKMLHNYSDLFCSLIVRMCFPRSESSGNLKEEITSIKRAIGGIDMTEEFAKYARLQRKLKEKERELISQENQFNRKALFFRTTVRIILFILIEGIRIYVIVHHRYTPVLKMDPTRLWPLGNIISYPMKVPGAVSPAVMMISSRQAITSAMSFFTKQEHRAKVKGL